LPERHCVVERLIRVRLVDVSSGDMESGVANGEDAGDEEEPLRKRPATPRAPSQPETDGHADTTKRDGARSGSRYGERVLTIKSLFSVAGASEGGAD